MANVGLKQLLEALDSLNESAERLKVAFEGISYHVEITAKPLRNAKNDDPKVAEAAAKLFDFMGKSKASQSAVKGYLADFDSDWKNYEKAKAAFERGARANRGRSGTNRG